MRHLVAAFVLCLASTVLAHPTVVLGTLESEPRTPEPGEPFTLHMVLEDPTRAPIEFAYVFTEFRPFGAPEAEPVVAEFEELEEPPGHYLTTLSLSEPGTYQLILRDQTYRQEETSATLTFVVGEGENPEHFDFLFPPTAVGGELWSWLIWLVGIPLVAGVIVTILVLTSSRKDDEGKRGAD
jgi:hypothetical protein